MNISRLKEIREDTQAQYCRYELGINTLPLEKLNKLANFYNTSTDYILYRTDKRDAYPKSIMLKTIEQEKEHTKI